MTSSGIVPSEAVIDAFRSFSLSGKKMKFDFIIARIDSNSMQVVIDNGPFDSEVIGSKDVFCGAPEYGTSKDSATPEERAKAEGSAVPIEYIIFKNRLVKMQNRFGWYTVVGDNGAQQLVQIMYNDDNSTSKMKMKYTTTKCAVTNFCKGSNKQYDANDDDEIAYKELFDYCFGKK